MVVGAALMGVGRFTFPLAFPIALKYVVDVLLVDRPKSTRDTIDPAGLRSKKVDQGSIAEIGNHRIARD
jgi:hypothetical protein